MKPKRTANTGSFKKGAPGRPKGVQNKLTRSAKEAFALAFDELGGYEGLVDWANSNPMNRTEFYKLYARLIPMDVTSGGEKLPTVVINAPNGEPQP